MNFMVADSPMEFIKGSQITNVVLIANECFDSRRRQEETGLLRKLDIELLGTQRKQ